MTLASLTIHELSDKIKKREASAVEVTQAVLDRIQKYDAKVGAFLHVCADKALAQARAVDEKISAKKPVGKFAGIPLAPKDIYLTEGIPTTCASKILEGYIPPYNGTVIERFLREDAVIVGKVNLDEFAMGSSTENSAYQKTRNPWNLDCVPGGSSGGSSAAVAADLCAASLGTDTGGSIRQPAALCGIVGLKPTYGRVSRYGVIAFASSLDQMGPMTKDVTDCALMMNVMAGHDPRDTTCLDLPVPDYTSFLGKGVKGLKVGLPKEYFAEGISPEIAKAVRAAVKTLEDLGAQVIEVSLPHTDYSSAAYYIIAPAEASSNLSRYDGIRYGKRQPAADLTGLYEQTRSKGFGREVQRRIMLGTYVLSAGYYDAYYRKAQKARTVILNDFTEVFKKVDILATPTTPTTAFKIGEKSSDPIQMYLSDICTIPVNMAGLPGMSLPCGLDSKGLPIGLQLIGKPFDEGTLIQAGHAYEQATTWHKQKPTL